jgi:arylsulfatase A-like enzyme/Tfp pilus assembly protein PilF
MRGIGRLVCIVGLAIAAFGSDAPPAKTVASGVEAAELSSSSPNIILITLDTTRADRMGFLGSKRGLTPNLDILARDSAVFTRAYAQAPLTPASHSTILTGTFPQFHQVLMFPTPLADNLPYLPEILKKHGYATSAFVGSIALDYKVGVPGFERGFDNYDAGFHFEGFSQAKRYETVERRAGVVVDHALAWVSEHSKSPFFIWVHVYDPHDPYDPPQPYKTRYAKAPYDGEIAYVDSAMGKLFKQLKASGLYDNTVVALTADHGEALGAHGEDEHGVFLYDETIHVPLLIKLPHGATAGERVETRVELADIMPTILGTLGIPVPEKVQGQSLLGFLAPETTPGAAAAKLWQERGAYSQADYGHLSFGWSALQSLRTGKYVFIQAPRRELYQDGTDPLEQHNLAPSSAAITDTLSAKVKDFIEVTTNKEETPKARMDEAKMQKLAILGYMAARPDSPLATPGQEGADPKDKIDIANVVLRINDSLQMQHCGPTMPMIQKGLKKYPDIALLHFFLGGCYLDKQDYDSAIRELRKTVQLDPVFSQGEFTLGRTLFQTGDYDGAMTAFQHVVLGAPGHMAAHIFLIVLYSKANRPDDVIKEANTVLKVMPENFAANAALGRALVKTGHPQEALAPLQKAIAGEPEWPEPHKNLADAYDSVGRPDDAKKERAEAERLEEAMAKAAAKAEAGDNSGVAQPR